MTSVALSPEYRLSGLGFPPSSSVRSCCPLSILDHNAVFIGSTDDGHTFVLVNRRVPGADQALTEAGFTALRQGSRTVYLLPPSESAQDAHEKTGQVMDTLFGRTLDIVNLSWTTHWQQDGPVPEPTVHIRFAATNIEATTANETASAVLTQHGFTAHKTASRHEIFVLPEELPEPEKLSTVLRVYGHLAAHKIEAHVHLGIATPDDIPPRPRPTRGVTPPSPTRKGKTR